MSTEPNRSADNSGEGASSPIEGTPPRRHEEKGGARERSMEEAMNDSADARTHGAHGGGRSAHDDRVDEAPPKPDVTRGSDRGGSGGWGSEGAGGSVVDKRGPKKKKK